jgi:hypothetical protein
MVRKVGVQKTGMMIEDRIKNSRLLTEIFGRWPSFHDSTVVQLTLDLGKNETEIPTSLSAQIKVMKLVSKDDGNGGWLWSHHLVTLRFFGIDDLKLGGWSFQNVLTDLIIEEITGLQSSPLKYEVVFEWCTGLWAEFKCSAITVESVGPQQIHKNQPIDEKTERERMRLVEEHLRNVRSRRS